MSKRRIFIPEQRVKAGEVELLRPEAKHLVTVLGLRDGDRVVVFDGEGREYDATLRNTGRCKGAALRIEGPGRKAEGGALDVTLIVALIKNRNFDLVVRKAAELGAARLVPVVTERTVKEAGAGVSRWRKISAEASRQCGRADVMDVAEVTQFGSAIASCTGSLRLMAWEGGGTTLAESLRAWAGGSISIAVGPEGGFTHGEVAAARAAGFVPVTLGPRILRTETVPLALLAIMQYVFGDLGGTKT
ncbi:MAG: 16S rRNA (uracil(1498)-N(3))-methyltransferase [Deltaproteobacteria bacterium]|nr:16S rRNA (uracil(1498)-N(3))-methyltransferase [Deltaproteobacteria bacterium]